MKFFICSDWHMGDGSAMDRFGWSEEEIIQGLSIIKQQVDEVVLLGDIYENYKFSLKKIREAYPKLCFFLENTPWIRRIRGNHDFVGEYPERYVISEERHSILMEHGYSADFNGSLLGRLFCRLWYRCLCTFKDSALMQKLAVTDLSLEKEREYRNTYAHKYLLHAAKKWKDYDVVVLAHSHDQEMLRSRYREKDTLYLNCGTCSEGRWQGIFLDTATLAYQFINEEKTNRLFYVLAG